MQVALSKDQNLPLESNIDVRAGAHRREDLNCLALAVDRGDQAQVVRREEVDLVGVLPNELVLVTLELVAPGEDKLRANVLDEGRLEIIQLGRAVGAVVDPQSVVGRQLHLFQFQIDRLIYPFYKLGHRTVYIIQ